MPVSYTHLILRQTHCTILGDKHIILNPDTDFPFISDEPEAGIDLWSFSMLIQKFEEINTEKKQSLIVISHQEKIINMACLLYTSR